MMKSASFLNRSDAWAKALTINPLRSLGWGCLLRAGFFLAAAWCFQAWTTCAVWFQTANKERFQRSSLTSLWKKNIYRVQSSLLWVLNTLIRWLDKWQTNLEYGPKTGVDATLKFWNICKGYDGCDVPTKVACCGSQHLCRTYDVQKSEGWPTFKKPPFQNVTSYVTSHRTSSAYRTKICWFHERNDAWNHVESIPNSTNPNSLDTVNVGNPNKNKHKPFLFYHHFYGLLIKI